MIAEAPPIVVVGIGNVLLRDDAVGVRVMEALAALAATDASAVPPATRFVDGGTLDIDLLRHVEGARAVLLIDGVDVGASPGDVSVLRRDAILASGARQRGGWAGGVAEIIAVGHLMGWLDCPVAMVGVQVGEIGFSLGLSPAVAAAVPVALDAARGALAMLDAEAADAAVPAMTGAIR